MFSFVTSRSKQAITRLANDTATTSAPLHRLYDACATRAVQEQFVKPFHTTRQLHERFTDDDRSSNSSLAGKQGRHDRAARINIAVRHTGMAQVPEHVEAAINHIVEPSTNKQLRRDTQRLINRYLQRPHLLAAKARGDDPTTKQEKASMENARKQIDFAMPSDRLQKAVENYQLESGETGLVPVNQTSLSTEHLREQRRRAKRAALAPLLRGAEGVFRDEREKDVVAYTAAEVRAFAVHRGAPEYIGVHSVLSEIALRAPRFQPTRVLDFGAGVGASFWAVQQVWPGAMKEAVAVEQCSHMDRALTKAAVQMGPEGMPCVPLRVNHLHNMPKGKNLRKHDLVVAAYALDRLESREAQLEYLYTLWGMTGDMLVLVEAGTRSGSATVRAMRQAILDLECKDVQKHQEALKREQQKQLQALHQRVFKRSAFGRRVRRTMSDAELARAEREVMAEVKERFAERGLKAEADCMVLAPCQHEHKCPIDGSKDKCIFKQRFARIPKQVVAKKDSMRPNAKASRVRNYQDERYAYVVLRRKKRSDSLAEGDALAEDLSQLPDTILRRFDMRAPGEGDEDDNDGEDEGEELLEGEEAMLLEGEGEGLLEGEGGQAARLPPEQAASQLPPRGTPVPPGVPPEIHALKQALEAHLGQMQPEDAGEQRAEGAGGQHGAEGQHGSEGQQHGQDEQQGEPEVDVEALVAADREGRLNARQRRRMRRGHGADVLEHLHMQEMQDRLQEKYRNRAYGIGPLPPGVRGLKVKDYPHHDEAASESEEEDWTEEDLAEWNKAMLRAVGQSARWSRIIMQPTKRKHHVNLPLCTPEGNLVRVTVAKSAREDDRLGRDGYRRARRSRVGDLWPYQHLPEHELTGKIGAHHVEIADQSEAKKLEANSSMSKRRRMSGEI